MGGTPYTDVQTYPSSYQNINATLGQVIEKAEYSLWFVGTVLDVNVTKLESTLANSAIGFFSQFLKISDGILSPKTIKLHDCIISNMERAFNELNKLLPGIEIITTPLKIFAVGFLDVQRVHLEKMLSVPSKLFEDLWLWHKKQFVDVQENARSLGIVAKNILISTNQVNLNETSKIVHDALEKLYNFLK